MLGNSFSKDTHPYRRRVVWACCAPAVAVGLAAAPAPAGAVPSRPVVTTATIPGLGTVLVAGQRPVYLFSHDHSGRSTCTGRCAVLFPPLVVSGAKAHHLGKLRGLKTIRRAGGHLQVSFRGHPLYLYTGDHSLSTASGQGLVNAWWTVRPNGAVVHTVLAAAPQTPASPAQGSTSTSSPKNSATSTTAPAGSGSNSSGSHGAPTTTPTTAPSPPTTTSPPAPPPPAPTTTPTTSPAPPPTTTTTSGSGGGGVGF